MNARDLFDAASRLRLECGDDEAAYERCMAALRERLGAEPSSPDGNEEADDDE